MLPAIKQFFLKRAYKKIKGKNIESGIKKLEILAMLTPNLNVSTYVKDRVYIEAHCPSVTDLPRMILSLSDDVIERKSLYIPNEYKTLKGGPVTEWCLNDKEEYVSILKVAPTLLKALNTLQKELTKCDDSFYVDYVNRKGVYFLEDVHSFISALKTIHY